MPPRVRAGLRDKYGLPAKAFKDKPKTELDTTVVKKAVASVSTSVADFVQANNLISGLANLLITSQASQHQDADPMAALADAERSAIASLASKDGGGSLLTEQAGVEAVAWRQHTQQTWTEYHIMFKTQLHNTDTVRLAVPHSLTETMSPAEFARLLHATHLRLDALKLEEASFSMWEMIVCLNPYVSIPECAILGQVLAKLLEDSNEQNESVATNCRTSFESWILGDLMNSVQLLNVNAVPEKPKDVITTCNSLIQFPAKVAQIAESFHKGAHVFRVNPVVAMASEQVFSNRNSKWRDDARWRALDGMYAVCGRWSHQSIASASKEEKATMFLVVSHATSICDQLKTSSPPTVNAEPLQEELAHVLFVVGNFHSIMKQTAKAQEFIKQAIEVFQAAKKTKIGPFLAQATYYMGNLLYQNGNLDEALEYHTQSITIKQHDVDIVTKELKDLNLKLADETALDGPLPAQVGVDTKQTQTPPPHTTHRSASTHSIETPSTTLSAIETCQQKQAAADVSIAHSHHQLGNICASKSKWRKARVHYTESLRLKEKYDLTDKASFALTLKTLARVHEQLNDIDAASTCTTKELEMLRQAHSTDLKHASISDCLQRLMKLRRQLKLINSTQ
eukprot:m.99110 g.99110  ORF g.99110 m.99110 type:complete len:624 (-) comp27130_c1_seq4:52-1923(-)